MRSPQAKQDAQTKKERNSTWIEKKAFKELRRFYPEYFDPPYHLPEITHLAEMSPHRALRADIRPMDDATPEPDPVYMLWDGGEITVHDDDLEGVLEDILSDQRERRMNERWVFFASPLFISGIIGMGLLSIIAGLLFRELDVPSQLWSVFTAVVAFYFGKEGWNALKRKNQTEEI